MATTPTSLRRARTALLLPVLLLPALIAGCGTVGLFGEYDIPESPEVAAAPWPRLVDVPDAPPAGIYAAGFPDPAEGVAAEVELAAEAAAARDRAGRLAAPVLTDADRRELGLE